MDNGFPILIFIFAEAILVYETLEYMPVMMGVMMKKHGFRMSGLSRICADGAKPIEIGMPEAVEAETGHPGWHLFL